MKLLLLNKKTIITLFIIAFMVRLAVGLYSYKMEIWNNFADDLAIESFAYSIIENGYIFDVHDFERIEFITSPVIPTVLAIKTVIFGDSWLPVFVLNAFLGAITCLLIYYIALDFFDKKVSFFVFAWAAIYPNYIRYTGTAGNEPWIVFLFALTFLFALKTIEIRKINYHIILYSLFFTLLFHTDERYISYSLLFTLFLFIGSSTIFLKFKKVILFIIFTILFSTPWLIRNYLVYDDIVLISCRTTNITDPVFKHRKEVKFYDHTPNKTYLSPAQIDSLQKGLLTEFSDCRPIREDQIEAIKSGNIPHRFTPTEKVLSRIYWLWMPIKFTDNYRITGYNFEAAWSLKHNLLTGLSYGLLLPFVLFAIVNLVKLNKWKEVYLFGGIMFYHTFIHVVFIPYTRDRYRHPIDFIIIILGCYGVICVYNAIKIWLCGKTKTNA